MSKVNYKIYTIEITETARRGIWYAKKKGERYKARLKGYVSTNGRADTAVAVFEVNPCQFVHPEDCKIISEELIKVNDAS
ncbi:MAG: hypothetical protein V4450_07290 [Bacteroidota bacterium]